MLRTRQGFHLLSFVSCGIGLIIALLRCVQGWHTYGPGMALRNKEGRRDFKSQEIALLTGVYAPYGARLMAILRHTSQDLPCLTTERGEQLRQKLETVLFSLPEFVFARKLNLFVGNLLTTKFCLHFFVSCFAVAEVWVGTGVQGTVLDVEEMCPSVRQSQNCWIFVQVKLCGSCAKAMITCCSEQDFDESEAWNHSTHKCRRLKQSNQPNQPAEK